MKIEATKPEDFNTEETVKGFFFTTKFDRCWTEIEFDDVCGFTVMVISELNDDCWNKSEFKTLESAEKYAINSLNYLAKKYGYELN